MLWIYCVLVYGCHLFITKSHTNHDSLTASTVMMCVFPQNKIHGLCDVKAHARIWISYVLYRKTHDSCCDNANFFGRLKARFLMSSCRANIGAISAPEMARRR